MHQRKILAVMFQVAAHAIAAVGILHAQKGVVSLMSSKSVSNFLVAFQALEGWRAGSELVARIALRRAVEGLVRFGERSRRDLGLSDCRAEKESAKYQQEAEELAHSATDGSNTTVSRS
jgi:hypothetical protein